MILDTTVCVDLLREQTRGERGPATEALAALAERRIYLSVFSVCELQTGAELSRRPEAERRAVNDLVAHFTVLYPGDDFAVLYGEAAAELIRSGTPIPTMDLLIGVLAKGRGMPLLTRDRRHFPTIHGLAVEWYG